MSFVTFLKSIGHDIKSAVIAVGHGFERLFGKQEAHDFGQAALGLLKSDLGQIVVAEVEALAGVSDMTGVQKAAQAQGEILTKAEQLGISTSKSIVNMLIELAVQFITGNLTADKFSTPPTAA